MHIICANVGNSRAIPAPRNPLAAIYYYYYEQFNTNLLLRTILLLLLLLRTILLPLRTTHICAHAGNSHTDTTSTTTTNNTHTIRRRRIRFSPYRLITHPRPSLGDWRDFRFNQMWRLCYTHPIVSNRDNDDDHSNNNDE